MLSLAASTPPFVTASGWFTWQFKAAIFLSLAIVAIALLLRRRSAALRHLAWTSVLTGLLALPVVSWLAPQWNLPLLPHTLAATLPASPSIPSVAQSNEVLASITTTPVPDLGPSPADDLSPLQHSQLTPDASPRPVADKPGNVADVVDAERSTVRAANPGAWLQNLARIVPFIWLLGTALLALRLAFAHFALNRLARRSHPVAAGPIADLSARTAANLGLRQPVTLLTTPSRSIPMTWGIVRPVVLLPETALAWPTERLQLVLAHELAHVRRRDSLVDLVAQLACLIYWMNPLAWWALARLRLEREQACDDVVLGFSPHSTVYAETLLAVVEDSAAGRLAPQPALLMARQSQIERRLRAVLDESRNRRGITRWEVITTISAVAAMSVLFGVLTLIARKESHNKANAGSPAPTQSGRIVGRVLEGGQPIAGVKLTLFGNFRGKGPLTFGKRTGNEAVTDADGRFAFEGVRSSGAVNVSVEKPGYDTVDYIPTLHVEPGATYEHPDIVIYPLDQVVAGSVVDLDGNPVPGATLLANDRKSMRPMRTANPAENTISGKDGRFSVKGLPNVPLTLTAWVNDPASKGATSNPFFAHADAEPGQTDVRIVLDPKLAKSTVRKLSPKISGGK